jgi:hypothetical protein
VEPSPIEAKAILLKKRTKEFKNIFPPKRPLPIVYWNITISVVRIPKQLNLRDIRLVKKLMKILKQQTFILCVKILNA